MADASPKVMEVVRAEIKKNPDISNKELLEKAKAVDKSVAKLSARQFNARYPLQVKRTMKPARRKARAKGAGKRKSGAAPARGKRAAAPANGQGRDKVRTVMLELARDVANAQGKGDVVDVIMGIDRYVDRVLKAAS